MPQYNGKIYSRQVLDRINNLKECIWGVGLWLNKNTQITIVNIRINMYVRNKLIQWIREEKELSYKGGDLGDPAVSTVGVDVLFEILGLTK